jgi:hypothetical protein
LPTAFALAQNYPNPFLNAAKFPVRSGENPAPTIEFALPQRACATVRIFILIGSEFAIARSLPVFLLRIFLDTCEFILYNPNTVV